LTEDDPTRRWDTTRARQALHHMNLTTPTTSGASATVATVHTRTDAPATDGGTDTGTPTNTPTNTPAGTAVGTAISTPTSVRTATATVTAGG
ncbi:hypothetical protein AAH978_21920, partial [Streptomyces sp. ZYX-F-203]